MFKFLKRKNNIANLESFSTWILSASSKSFPEIFQNNENLKEQFSNEDIRFLKFECITIYLSLTLQALSSKGETEKLFSKKLHAYMFDLFEIALREQGVSDVRIAPEIRKLAAIFHKRLETYKPIFEQNNQEQLEKCMRTYLVIKDINYKKEASKCIECFNKLNNLSFNEIASFIQ